jgi:hypothetical protein
MRRRNAAMAERRTQPLQVILAADELAAVEEFRYQARMPSRSAAVRELLRRGWLVRLVPAVLAQRAVRETRNADGGTAVNWPAQERSRPEGGERDDRDRSSWLGPLSRAHHNLASISDGHIKQRRSALIEFAPVAWAQHKHGYDSQNCRQPGYLSRHALALSRSRSPSPRLHRTVLADPRPNGADRIAMGV